MSEAAGVPTLTYGHLKLSSGGNSLEYGEGVSVTLAHSVLNSIEKLGRVRTFVRDYVRRERLRTLESDSERACLKEKWSFDFTKASLFSRVENVVK